MKHVVCYSGGHSSARVAVSVARKFPNDEIILLNHDINPNVELADVKRFKKEIAEYLGLNITYANYEGIEDCEEIPDQFDVAMKIGGFKFGNGTELCTHRLKTKPFYAWLDKNCDKEDTIIYYGFDANETHRIQRRSSILGKDGWKSDYPIALWKDGVLGQTIEIGINPPAQYDKFKHANCIGCLKAGKQHWYIVYCERPDLWEKAKLAEDELGHSIIRDAYLEELEPKFKDMQKAGIKATEHIAGQTFWAQVKKTNLGGFDFSEESNQKPCECVF